MIWDNFLHQMGLITTKKTDTERDAIYKLRGVEYDFIIGQTSFTV